MLFPTPPAEIAAWRSWMMHATIDGASKPTSLPLERRERRPVSMSGFAVLPGGLTHEILLLDLSYEGCGIETPVPLEAGQKIKISVLRRGGNRCGGALERG